MRRELRFIKLLLKLRLSQMMVFRLSFFGSLFVDGSLFMFQLLSFNAIYGQVEAIGAWGRGEMIIFIGTFSLINAINMVVYFFGVINIPTKVKEGSLDHYLTKPINPLLRLSLESIDIGSVPLLLFSTVIIAYGISQLNITIGIGTVLLYVVFVLLMCILYYDMEVILRTISFFVISTSSIDRLEGECIEMCMKIPGNLFKGVFKLLFCVLLPYGIMATVPAKILSESISMRGLIYAILIVIIFTVIMLKFWKYGLKHYKSASS